MRAAGWGGGFLWLLTLEPVGEWTGPLKGLWSLGWGPRHSFHCSPGWGAGILLVKDERSRREAALGRKLEG